MWYLQIFSLAFLTAGRERAAGFKQLPLPTRLPREGALATVMGHGNCPIRQLQRPRCQALLLVDGVETTFSVNALAVLWP